MRILVRVELYGQLEKTHSLRENCIRLCVCVCVCVCVWIGLSFAYIKITSTDKAN